MSTSDNGAPGELVSSRKDPDAGICGTKAKSDPTGKTIRKKMV